MPFQTYQLALDVIRRDRQEKLTDIQLQQDRLNKIVKFGKTGKGDRRLLSMARRLEYLHIQSEINLPRTKYNFDRGKCMLPSPPPSVCSVVVLTASAAPQFRYRDPCTDSC